MDFISLLDDRVYLDAQANNTNEVFQCIANVMANDVLSSNNIYQHLLNREMLGSTGLGYGVAIPHGRIKGLKDTLISIIRTKQDIDFNAPDNIKVNFFIGILVPEQANQQHLDLLANIAMMLSDENLRNDLINSSSKEQILQSIKNYQSK